MKNSVKLFVFVFAFLSALSLAVWAAQETSTISSPKCDEAKVAALAGDALVKIEPAKWDGSLPAFIVTLNTDKLSFGKLAEKMKTAGCY